MREGWHRPIKLKFSVPPSLSLMFVKFKFENQKISPHLYDDGAGPVGLFHLRFYPQDLI